MTLSEKTKFSIKGQKDGLLICLGDGDWSFLLESLKAHILERKTFFSGAKITLDVGERLLSVSEISFARDQLSTNHTNYLG